MNNTISTHVNNTTTFRKIDLISFRMKCISIFFSISLLGVGFYLSFLFFYSNNLVSFTAFTLVVFLTALLVVNCFYILKHIPDQSSHVPWKITLNSIAGVNIIGFIQILVNNKLIFLIEFLNPLVPFIPFVFGLYLITLIIPKKILFFNPDNHQLAYLCDYGTQIKKKSILLSNVHSIEIEHIRRISLSGRSGKIVFHLNNLQNTNESNNLVKKTVREWDITSPVLLFVYYTLIDIFRNYPLILTAKTIIPAHPLKPPFKHLISPTQVNFSENTHIYFSKLLQSVSENPLNDMLLNNINSSSQEKKTLPKKQLVMESTQEIVGQYLYKTNKYFVAGSVVILLLLIIASFQWVNVAQIIFIQQELLRIFLNLITSSNYSLYFNNQYFYNLYFYSVYLFTYLMLILVLYWIIAWIGLLSIFGREYFIFKDELIIFSVKVYNKKLITRKIPKRSIITIEHSDKALILQLLGGDSFVFKISNPDEEISILSILKKFLLSNT